MRWSWLTTFMPEEVLSLVAVVLGIALAMKVVRGGAALRLFFGLVILPLLLPPLLRAVLAHLSPWISLPLLALLGVWVGFSFIQGVTSLLLGKRVSDEMWGHIAADVVRVILRVVFAVPAHIVRIAFRMKNNSEA